MMEAISVVLDIAILLIFVGNTMLLLDNRRKLRSIMNRYRGLK